MALPRELKLLPAIGEQRVKKLANLGIFTCYDLLRHFPRDYEDRTSFKSIFGLIDGEHACVRAVVSSAPKTAKVKNGLTLTKLKVFDETGEMALTFFNAPYLQQALKEGAEYDFYGRASRDRFGLNMVNPEFEPAGAGKIMGRLMPVYRLTEGISRKVLLQAIQGALALCEGQVPDFLPQSAAAKYQFIDAFSAYRKIHFPSSISDIEEARRRLMFEELFLFTCVSAKLRQENVEARGIKMARHEPEGFYARLPFEPTGAQKAAVLDAYSDMCSGRRMNRLLQGDVGSGKTMVAAACIDLSSQNGCQSAFMAPTEILAAQHYQNLSPILEGRGLSSALLTSSTKKKEKDAIKEGLKDGRINVVFGTHALLTDDVVFKDAGLFIVDEQHRFGVRQRAALSAKAQDAHVLVMSATPIPRTLTLIIYGDLDVSNLREMPKGRLPVLTYMADEGMRARVNQFIRKQEAQGGRSYIICPLIEGDDKRSVERVFAQVQSALPELSVGMLHGKMKPKEKELTMQRFAGGELSVLVATTVVEVGVDVKEATLIVIEQAQLFGLSQLHQLRGRVGRGEMQSYCILLSEDKHNPRLKALCSTNDGFLIAEEDLKLRGPGDFFGTRQHGMPEFKLIDLSHDTALFYEAAAFAKDFVGSGELERHPHILKEALRAIDRQAVLN